jgi:hypothetical protein
VNFEVGAKAKGVVFACNELAAAIGKFKLQLTDAQPIENRENQSASQSTQAVPSLCWKGPWRGMKHLGFWANENGLGCRGGRHRRLF